MLHLPYTLHSIKSATSSIGIPPVADINSPNAPAVGHATLDITVDRSMYRASTYRAFLSPEITQARKARLKVATNTLVSRIKTSVSSNGKIRATGVYFEAIDPKLSTQKYFATATREVVLCCGALGSPQLLQLR